MISLMTLMVQSSKLDTDNCLQQHKFNIADYSSQTFVRKVTPTVHLQYQLVSSLECHMCSSCF